MRCSRTAPPPPPASSPATWSPSIDGRKIDSFSDMQRIVSVAAGEQLTIVVERGGVPVTLQATPQWRELKDPFGNAHRLGVLGISRSMAPGDIKTQKMGPFQAVDRRRPGDLVRGRPDPRPISAACSPAAKPPIELGGPIRIAQVSGEVASAGFAALMHLTAVLSISIGLLNLFPIPLLDGGHLLFYGIEAVARPPHVGAGAGSRLPHRPGDRRHVDDFCNL